MRYFATFTDTGERLNTYVADGMPLTALDIMKKYPNAIEISETDQSLYMQGYIRGRNGKPKKIDKQQDISVVKKNKIDVIKKLAKAKLIETDHDIVEYLELQNLTVEEYEELKRKRQNIRDYRERLIQIVNEANNIDAINNLEFLL